MRQTPFYSGPATTQELQSSTSVPPPQVVPFALSGEVSYADIFTFLAALCGFIYTISRSKKDRKLHGFDVFVLPKITEFTENIELLDREARRLLAGSNLISDDAFEEFKEKYPSYISAIDDCTVKYLSAYRTWRAKHDGNKRPLARENVDELYGFGNSIEHCPVNERQSVINEIRRYCATLITESQDAVSKVNKRFD